MSSVRPTFISVSLVSNRPREFMELLDNFEQTAYDPARVELIVGIDDGDAPMQQLVREEQKRRKLKLKFLSSPYTGFLNLYKAFDEMHYKLCDPDAYFVQHIFDELRHRTMHWDKILEERYTGLFDDDIYRLRLSIYKLWNYHSVEECGPHPENLPIVTKKWIDLTGWCACHSADSYQQMVAYFLGRVDDGANRFFRDVPIFDISMEGLQAGVGVQTPEEIKEYEDRAKEAWRILLSDAMQLNAQEKANLLRAHIKCAQKGIKNFSVSHSARFTHVFDGAKRELMAFPLIPPARKAPVVQAAPPADASLPAPEPVGRGVPLCVRGVRLVSRILRLGRRAVRFAIPR